LNSVAFLITKNIKKKSDNDDEMTLYRCAREVKVIADRRGWTLCDFSKKKLIFFCRKSKGPFILLVEKGSNKKCLMGLSILVGSNG
jgi:hypothetical protein